MGVLLPKQPSNSWKKAGMEPILQETQRRLSHAPFNGAAASPPVNTTTTTNGTTRPVDKNMADGEVPMNNKASTTCCAMNSEMRDHIDVIPGTFGVSPCAPSVKVKGSAVNFPNCKSYMRRHEAVKSRNINKRDDSSKGFRSSSSPHFLPREEHGKRCEKKGSRGSSGSDFILKRIPSRFMSTVMASPPVPERDFQRSGADTESDSGGQIKMSEDVIGGNQRKKLSVRGSAGSIMAASLAGNAKSTVRRGLSSLQLYRNGRAKTERKHKLIEQWLADVEEHRRERLQRE
ncbi:hypothetical protein TRSC58_07216 [Trypanosoma rangeli SC58]|uniref:Uncharacterized protein n=1 Tax=Trypanosoma rangeli SC58 TaxID=429131 RepID=A0A061IS64_TRYRA|nr:hypothetical protein TRSC58_07216 [Trypanosoma rangeli SC58]